MVTPVHCSRCGADYQEPIAQCPRCNTAAGTKDTELRQRIGDYAPLLSTYNAADIAIVRSILDHEQIEYHVQGEFFNMAEPLVQPARFYVPETLLDTARRALGNLELRFLGVSLRDSTDRQT
jgi:hypothetical protein